MLRLPILFILLAATGINLTKDKSWLKQQLTKFALISKMSSSGRRPITLPEKKHIKNQSLLTLLILLLGDIEANPGPRQKQASVYPCGLCDHPVTWTCEGVCCDDCNVWHHKSCFELCIPDYELLQRSNVQWYCCKCESLNVDTFTSTVTKLTTRTITTQ